MNPIGRPYEDTPALIGNAYAQGTHTPLLPQNLRLFTDSCACACRVVGRVCRVPCAVVRVRCRWSLQACTTTGTRSSVPSPKARVPRSELWALWPPSSSAVDHLPTSFSSSHPRLSSHHTFFPFPFFSYSARRSHHRHLHQPILVRRIFAFDIFFLYICI